MTILTAILSLLTGVAGWFYLFYSRGAAGLADLEEQRLNAWRVRLRRIGGGCMLVLAVALYVGFQAAADPVQQTVFVAAWSAVIILLGLLVVLAVVDVLFTIRLRQRHLRESLRSRSPRGNSLDRQGPSN